jgi:hypothetical protein
MLVAPRQVDIANAQGCAVLAMHGNAGNACVNGYVTVPTHHQRCAAQRILDSPSHRTKAWQQWIGVALRPKEHIAMYVPLLIMAGTFKLPGPRHHAVYLCRLSTHADHKDMPLVLEVISQRNTGTIPSRRVFGSNHCWRMIPIDREPHGARFAAPIPKIPADADATATQMLSPPRAPHRMTRAVDHQDVAFAAPSLVYFVLEWARGNHGVKHLSATIGHLRIDQKFNAHSMSFAA